MKKNLKNIFDYPPIRALKLNEQEKKTWEEIAWQIYYQDQDCKNLPNDKCSNEAFVHIYLKRDSKTKQIVIGSYYCLKRKLQSNYLIRGFAANKLSLSLINDKNPFPMTDPDEFKIDDLLKESIKNNERIGLYFYGHSGIGKTHKIISYCNDMIINHNQTVAYVFLPQFVREIKENFGLDSSVNKKMIDYCCDADILVLDDFGAEYTSAWFYLNVLLIILNSRCENNKKVIVISNFDPCKVAKILKNAIILNSSYGKEDNETKLTIVERLFDRLVQLTNNKKLSYNCNSRRQASFAGDKK